MVEQETTSVEPKDFEVHGSYYLTSMDSDTVLKSLEQQLDAIKAEEVEKIKSMLDEVKKAKKEFSDRFDATWKQVEDRLMDIGALPSGYNPEKHAFSVNKHNQIFLEEKECNHEMPSFLKKMLADAQAEGANVSVDVK